MHLAQELVQGTSLALYLAGGNRLELDLLRSVCQGVLEALQHLHSGDVVHRSARSQLQMVKSSCAGTSGRPLCSWLLEAEWPWRTSASTQGSETSPRRLVATRSLTQWMGTNI